MITSIAESISNQSNFFKNLLTVDDKDICISELIMILDRITEELADMSEIAKTYPQEEAIVDLQSHYALIRIVAEFQERLERSNYLGNENVELSLARVWRAMLNLSDEISDAAHLNRQSDRDCQKALIKSRMCHVCPFKSLYI